MQIVFLKKLIDFSKKHATTRKSLSSWKAITENATWKNKQDVLPAFPKAKMIKITGQGFRFYTIPTD